MKSRYRIGFVMAGVFIIAASGAAAQRGERLSDKEVKQIIDAVDTGRDKFEGNLDGGFKGSTLRGPNGETKVSGALQDYQDSTKKLQERFTADYSASAEAATVLKQSMQIHAFMTGPKSPAKGRNEWDRQTTNLRRLAEAYGTTFPLPDGATIRRMNDKESAAAAAHSAFAGTAGGRSRPGRWSRKSVLRRAARKSGSSAIARSSAWFVGSPCTT